MDAKAAALEVTLQLEAGCSVNVPMQKAMEQQLDEKLVLKLDSMAVQQYSNHVLHSITALQRQFPLMVITS